MKKTYWIVGIIVIIAIIAGGYFYNYNSSTTKTDENLPEEYSMLKESDYLNYLMFSAVGSEDVANSIAESSNGKLTYQFSQTSGFLEGLTCTSTNKKPIIKEASSYYPGGDIIGGWSEVVVVDCGDSYFISSESDANWQLYGPFEN